MVCAAGVSKIKRIAHTILTYVLKKWKADVSYTFNKIRNGIQLNDNLWLNPKEEIGAELVSLVTTLYEKTLRTLYFTGYFCGHDVVLLMGTKTTNHCTYY